jgi:hypothetical protein
VGTRRGAFGVGNAWSLFPSDDRRTLRIVVLMALTRGRYSPEHESSVRSAQLIRRWGLPRESAPWSDTGDGEVLMGRRFWVGCGWFFSWRTGEGKRKLQGTDC